MNLQAAAHRLGVHYQTAYRWVREGRLEARKFGGTYEVDDAEVDRFLAVRALPVPPPSRAIVRNWSQHVDRLVANCLDGEELEARNTVERLFEGGVSVLDLAEELFVPCMVTVGERWHAGDITVAEEHRSTTILGRVAARLTSHPRGRPRGTAVVATAPGDSHEFASLLAALVLMEDHWRVHHLGANLAAEEIVDLAKRVEATLVVISTIYADPAAQCATLERDLAAPGRRVLIGGAGRQLAELRHLARGEEPAVSPGSTEPATATT